MQEALFKDKGAGIRITPSQFVVRSSVFPISAIARVDLVRIRPKRMGGLGLVLAGVGGSMASRYLPIPSATCLAIGIAFTLVGLWRTVRAKASYAVRLATARGPRDAVITGDERYAEKIVQALGLAMSSEPLPARSGS